MAERLRFCDTSSLAALALATTERLRHDLDLMAWCVQIEKSSRAWSNDIKCESRNPAYESETTATVALSFNMSRLT